MAWTMAMALYALRRYFGDAWVQRHLINGGFLKPPPFEVSPSERQQVVMQGYLLAESLFNFQSQTNFDEIYDRLTAGEIEPCIGELEAGRFLSFKDERFNFRKRTKRRGQDFDIEWLKEGVLICCETKARLESQILDSHQVWRKLDDARKKNLPEDQPGLVFLRVLGHYDRESLIATTAIVKSAADRLFRQSGRLLGVVMLTRAYSFEDDTLSM